MASYDGHHHEEEQVTTELRGTLDPLTGNQAMRTALLAASAALSNNGGQHAITDSNHDEQEHASFHAGTRGIERDYDIDLTSRAAQDRLRGIIDEELISSRSLSDFSFFAEKVAEGAQERLSDDMLTRTEFLSGRTMRNVSDRMVRTAVQGVAKVAPGVGIGVGLLSSSTSVAKGNYVDAGLEWIGAIPGVGDVIDTALTVGDLTLLTGEMIHAAAMYAFSGELTEEQQQAAFRNHLFHSVFDALPDEATADTHPAIKELIAARDEVLAADALPKVPPLMNAVDTIGLEATSERWEDALASAQDQFAQVFDRLWDEGAFAVQPDPVLVGQQVAPEQDMQAALEQAQAEGIDAASMKIRGAIDFMEDGELAAGHTPAEAQQAAAQIG